jgi:hypothetical protein
MARFKPSSERRLCGVLFAKYQEELEIVPGFVSAGVASAGRFTGLLAVRPFKQGRDNEAGSENTKHSKRHKRHIPPSSMVRAIRS